MSSSASSSPLENEIAIPLVDTAEGLSEVAAAAAGFDRIAVDTEADSLHCYFEKLCLIQVSVPGGDWLVDPLAGVPMEPLFDVLSNKVLILHGADYDLRLMRRIGFQPPARIFDTMIAARLSGVEEFSLAALLKRHFGLEIPKASQKANWARRPLSPAMLAYAINDTRHLHKLAEIYEGELRSLGRWEWFEQMCDRAIRATENSKEKDTEAAWRISGSGNLRGRTAAMLRELWRWRDEEARAVDRPPFHILHNEQLLKAALELDAGRRVHFQHLRGNRLRRFEEAVEKARAMPETEWPVYVRVSRPRPTKEEEDRMKVLRAKRDEIASRLKLDPSLVAPKATIEGLVLREAETMERLLPWQRELLGI
ncbi:MAG TPA: HRDC domain-containing protein [Chthoniobacteraceae bacterium]|nr:HRDC domain-containing protein [Chthoniobacteraceae bacterium]